jgi:hypothetical protein
MPLVAPKGAPPPPSPNQDILALVQWIDAVCGAGGNPGALDATSSAMQQAVASSDTSAMTSWLADGTDGPQALKAHLLTIRALLGELAQDRTKLAQPAPAPAKPPQGTPVPPTTVTVTAAQAVGMSAGAFVLGGLLGGAVMHHVGKKKTHAAREDDDEEETREAREAPRRKKPAVAKAPAKEEG